MKIARIHLQQVQDEKSAQRVDAAVQPTCAIYSKVFTSKDAEKIHGEDLLKYLVSHLVVSEWVKFIYDHPMQLWIQYY